MNKIAINGATTMPYKLEDEIRAAAEAGFSGVEIWWDKIVAYCDSHHSLKLKSLLDENNIKPIGLCPFAFSPFRNQNKYRKTFQQGLKVADEIGCSLLTICPDFKPVSLSKEEALNKLAGELDFFAESASEYQIKLAVEPIGGHTLIPGPMEALELIQRTKSAENIGIVMDTFHYMRSVVSPETVRKIPVEKLYIVHVNDSEDGYVEELADKNRLYPLEGKIDLRGYMKALNDIRYDGYYSVELFRPEYWEEPVAAICEKAFASANNMMKLK